MGALTMALVQPPSPSKGPSAIKRTLLAACAIVLGVALAWLAIGSVSLSRLGSLQRFQVRLNFSALIDWSGSSNETTPYTSCAEALGIQTVALMFLTTGPMPHDRSWKLWLSGAAGWLPYQGLPAAKAAACGTTSHQWEQLVKACSQGDQQHLFKLYVHAQPNFTGYEAGSVFHGRLIPYRVETRWGEISLVVAERLLLQAALQDRTNSRFLLISDSGIPLYDPLTFYQQLMHEDKSRVKGCRVGYLSEYRWHPVMALKGIRRAQWRKSSQWFSLTREHAELVANDQQVFDVFHRYCHGPTDRRRKVECYPDEHYIPTLLSIKGLENETYCSGFGLAATNWTWGGPHPRAWRSREVKPWLMAAMRMTINKGRLPQCNSTTTVITDSQNMFVPLRPALESAEWGEACRLLKDSGQGVVTAFKRPLPGDCPLTARKFPKFTMIAVSSLLKRTCLGGSITGNCTGIKAAAVLEAGSTPPAFG